MALFGALSAMLIRWQLAWPWSEMPVVGGLVFPKSGGVPSPEFYSALFTFHGTVMIFFVVIPLLTGWLGNYLIPLLIGARDMAFPVLNMISYWIMPFAMASLAIGFCVEGGSAQAGWTSYPPLATLTSATPGSLHGQTWWLLAIVLAGISSTLGAVNYVTTVVKLRAKGMGWLRMPLTVWALFLAACIQLAGIPVLTSGGILQLSDRVLGSGFYSASGSPLLWQHLFWFYGHPAVYVVILPAMGVVSDVLSVHARKGVFGYKPMVFSLLGITLLGFMVWAHHMFVSGMNPALGMAFGVATTLIALPSGVKVFNWLATLWGARLQLTSAMLFALGFVALFITGGLSGLWLACTPVDVYMHDTYFVVAHFHFIVFGGSVFGLFAAFYHWFPKMFGRMLDERLGRAHFVLTFVLAVGVFLMMHQLGLAGMPRRIADPTVYPSLRHLVPLNVSITWCALLLGASQVLFLANLFWSLWRGPRAPRNPWKAASLEWEADSPPPHGNFGAQPEVERGPYEYDPRTDGRDFQPQAVTLFPPA
ncbi:MAG: cbb3-type cytochrome c oxidase subunit I [Planctomycetes bacterium]|nr:cbb3-type cytochrome c oxidase subunit I [Planctomycetota bacterium]